MYLIFDTETTGLPKNYNAPLSDFDNWPRLVQIAWQLHDNTGALIKAENYIIKPEGFTIPFNSEKVHGISTKIATEHGHQLDKILKLFAADIEKATWLIGHNIEFDLSIMGAEFLRCKIGSKLLETKEFCTKIESTEFVAIEGKRKGKFKWPNLTELHIKLFGTGFGDAHDAAYDVDATAKCFFGLLTTKVRPPADDTLPENIVYQAPKLAEANFAKAIREEKNQRKTVKKRKEGDPLIPFCHLHNHSQFSVLQSTSDVKALVKKAKAEGMEAVAFTDYGNMMAAFKAVAAGKSEEIKVIIGCELYVAKERKRHKFTKVDKDVRFQQVLLAKNQNGYKNLSKICSYGFIEGFYFGVPRVGMDLITEYKQDLIALTGNIYVEIPSLILNESEEKAEEAFRRWLDIFEDDFYIELIRHGLPEEERVNEVLLRFAEKFDVKIVATNDTFYIDKSDADAHDSMLCVKDGEKKATEIGQGRAFRFGFSNQEYYFKSQEEMNDLFADIPQALQNTIEIADKCSELTLERDILLPAYELPEGFTNQDDYLKHLTFEGAKERYGDVTPAITERLEHELNIIKTMGFPGYFLIVQDFIAEARNMGVSVGPGRGSAAGSAAAYCIGITNIDPIHYNLLFERFLNPERVSMPDIDIDFDDVGRAEVIDYVVEKYGKTQVAQIITYGTMAARSSIKDVARVMDLPLAQSNALAKLVPEKPGTTLKKAFAEVAQLQEIHDGDDDEAKVLQAAVILEGSVRNTGTHAAGVIIAPDDLTDYIPVCTSKDAELLITQFDGKVVEDAGMLKMDFLGLKTLTIIKDAITLIEQNYPEVKIEIDEIDFADSKTYELYQRGDTIGTFQFESDGMRKYLKELKPSNIEDLIAMNALYRPGPMDFIPSYILRKHGKEEVEYPHDLLKPILEPTFGIMIYQEQIMQTAQILAGYSLGGADILRRAMGKKKLSEMEKQRGIFVEGAKEKHDIEKAKAEDVFSIMEKFASYGFNRSHSAAYSMVAFQTGYLKAHYPAEYMASVLTHNMGNIDKVTFFIDECKHQNIEVLGPDINESLSKFNVNKKGQIRFGLQAIKGAGDAAVQAIITERTKNGDFTSIFDLVERMSLNKKTFEALVMGGAFDCFGTIHRAQYFNQNGNESNIEKIVKYGKRKQEEAASAQVSMFGGGSGVNLAEPTLPDCPKWTEIEKLNNEKEVVGFYISGHPLDQYKLQIDSFCNATLEDLQDLEELRATKKGEIRIAGSVSGVDLRDYNGRPFALFNVEDYTGSSRLALFGEEYLKAQHLLQAGLFIRVCGKIEFSKKKEQWNFNVKKVELLAEVGQDKEAVGMFIDLEIKEITEVLLDDLEVLFEQHEGKCPVKFRIKDIEQKMQVPLKSLSIKIQPNNKLVKSLERLKVDYRLVYK